MLHAKEDDRDNRDKAFESAPKLGKKNSAKLGGGKPVASDLILIDKKAKLRFIEVKLSGDRIRPNQLISFARFLNIKVIING